MNKCIDCLHWHSSGDQPYQGYCITSATCVNTKNHPRFTPKAEVNPIPEMRLRQGGDIQAKGRTAFISDEDIVKALQSRQRETPLYQDMRTLTDESKKELRKERRKKSVPENS